MRTLSHAIARATPEQRAWIAFLRRAGDAAESPERQAARAEIARSVHGIVVEHWRCSCGTAYAYPHSICPTCRREYPRRCLTSGCGNVNEPTLKRTDGGVECELVATFCPSCTADTARRGRAQSYARSNIPPREKAWAMRLVDYAEQRPVLAALDAWMDLGPNSRLWKRDRNELDAHFVTQCAVYLGGQPGRGKSVLAAYVCYRAFVDLGLVEDFRWHSQATLQVLFAARHSGTDEQRAIALQEWRAVVDCRLLVIDDIFSAPLTPAFGDALAALIRERLDQVRPLVMTSNHPPTWTELFDCDEVGRLASRWRAYGMEFVVRGLDLRRAA